MADQSIKFTLLIDDKGSASMKKVASSADKLDRQTVATTKSVKGLTSSLVAVAAVAGGIYLVKKSMDTLLSVANQSLASFGRFESALVDMGKVTQRSFATLRSEVMLLPPELGNATELMKGYYQVISAGITDPVKALKTLVSAAKASSSAHVEQSQVVKGLTGIMEAYTEEVKNASDAADLMFAIESAGKTSVAELIPYIGELASRSAALGISQNELGAAFAQVTKLAGNTSVSATQYKAIMISLMKPTKELSELLEQYGGVQKAIAELGFGGVLRLIAKEAGGSAEKTSALLGSSESLAGFLAVTSKNLEGYNLNLEIMGDKTGRLDTAFKNWQKTLEASKKTWEGTVEKFLMKFGEELVPGANLGLNEMSTTLEENTDLFIDWAKRGIGGAVKGIGFFIQAIGWIPTAAFSALEAIYLMSAGLVAVAQAALQLERLSLFKKDREHAEKWIPVLQQIGEDLVGAGDNAAQSATEFAEMGVVIDGIVDKLKKLGKEAKGGAKGEEELADQTEATVEVLDKLDEGLKEVIETTKELTDEEKKLAADLASAYRDIYGDLKDSTDKYYTYQRKILDEEYKKYAKIIKDKNLLDVWLANEKKKILKEEIKDSDDFYAGISVALDDILQEQMTWGQAGYDVVQQMFASSTSAGADFFNFTKDSFGDLGDFLKKVGDDMVSIWANILSRMVTEWAMSGLTRLAVNIGISGAGVLGTSTLAQASAAGGGGGLSNILGLGGLFSTMPGQTASAGFMAALKIPGVGMVPNASGGVSLGIGGTPLSTIGMGAGLGALGYSTIGSMIGLPQGGYSTEGAGIGAAVGTAILPGIGTILGSIGGGLLGSLIGGSKAGMGSSANYPMLGWGEVPDLRWEDYKQMPRAGSRAPRETRDQVGIAVDTVLQNVYDTVDLIIATLPEAKRSGIEAQLATMQFPLNWTRFVAGIGGGQEQIRITRENVEYIEEDIAKIPEYIMAAVMPVLMRATGKATVEEFNHYLMQIEAATQVSASTIMDAFKGTIETGDWAGFEKKLRDSIFNSVSEGMIAAVMQSEVISRALGPVYMGISQALEDLASGGRIATFEAAVSTQFAAVNETIIQLKPLFDVMSESLGSLGRVLGIDEKLSVGQEGIEDWQKGNWPSYQTGIDFVPKTGPVIVHRGEKILTEEENRSMQQVNIILNADIITTDHVDAWLADRLRKLREFRVGDQIQTIDVVTAGLDI